ncbi:MAG: DUF1700 domain-containing protein [Lachnospiraceae bacterium]|nr:DUF1700 domain-containing protein [Lachnospiraceae bacterium]
MSRKEFMEELQVLLGELPVEEREEALRYYESYFDEAGPEQEQVVLEELGSAGRIATQILRDYRMENGGGMYTEQGYRENENGKQTPVKYAGEEQKTEEQTQESTQGSGITITRKGLSGGSLVVLILIAILTFPIWISLLATAFGLLMGLFGAGIGIIFGFGFGGVGCLIGGVAAFVVGAVKSVAVPVVGAGLIAIGLVVFGVGCLMLAAVGGIIKVFVWMVKGIINFLSRIFHGKKVATA